MLEQKIGSFSVVLLTHFGLHSYFLLSPIWLYWKLDEHLLVKLCLLVCICQMQLLNQTSTFVLARFLHEEPAAKRC